MSNRVLTIIKILMVVAMLLGPVSVLAQQGETPTQSTTGQQDQDRDQDQDQQQDGRTAAQALAFDDTWRQLNPGDVHWYAFQYDGHLELREADDAEADDGASGAVEMESVLVASDIIVWADSTPDNSINFSVWTRNNLDTSGAFDVDTFGTDVNALPQDGTGPVGMDAECEAVPGDVCWAGSFQEAGTYYIRVAHDNTFGQLPVSYRLGIEGVDVRTDLFGQAELTGQDGVGSTQNGTNGSQDGTNGQDTNGQDTNGQQATDGQARGLSGTAQALTGRTAAQALGFDSTAFRQLNPGEVHWYAFRYDGHYELRETDDAEADDGASEAGEMESVFVPTNILVWADSVPDNSINFAVWTRNNLDAAGAFDVDTFGTDLAAQPQDGSGPVGFDAECGEDVRGNICWAGTFHEAGVYYVRVSHDPAFGQQPAFYRLFVEGVDVRTDLSGQPGLTGQ